MADNVKALVHHVDIAMAAVRTPAAATKRTLGRPLHRRCPNGTAGSKWKTSDIKAELDL